MPAPEHLASSDPAAQDPAAPDPACTYPAFGSGQTLTAAELNTLRAFLHGRDRIVAGLVGFGINAGLGGVVAGNRLTIRAGLAVDQRGEPLVLPAAVEFALPFAPAPPATAQFDFVDHTAGGFAVVLEATDVVEPAADCGQSDCAGHAELHTLAAGLRVVAGRLRGSRADFAAEPLLRVTPVEPDSVTPARYAALRDALVERLTRAGSTPAVAVGAIAALHATALAASDLPVVKAYKCGWLDLVLFAALDLLRLEHLLSLGVRRDAPRPGVVLGWVAPAEAGSWRFECAYRHAWEPPRGFTEALLGGSCTDPAALLRSDLEQIIAGYHPPVPAARPDDPPRPPPPLRPDVGEGIAIRDERIPVYVPPRAIPQEWAGPWQAFDPKVPIWNPPFERPTWQVAHRVFGDIDPNYFGDGLYSVSQYAGLDAARVAATLTEAFTEGAGAATVRIVTPAELASVAGYRAACAVSPSDTVVLTADGAGVVIGVGVVPGVQTVRTAGAALPAALGAAARATEAADVVRELAGTLSGRVEAVGADLRNLGHLVDTLRLDVAAVRAGGGRVQQLSAGVSEFAETVIAALGTLTKVENPNFRRYLTDAERAHARFEIAAASDDPAAVTPATFEVLSTLRTAVKSAGVPAAQASQLDAQLRALKSRFA